MLSAALSWKALRNLFAQGEVAHRLAPDLIPATTLTLAASIQQWSFLSFLAVFELGSLLCATAVDTNMFIGGRAIAGAGGSGVVLGAFSIVSFLIPLVQRPSQYRHSFSQRLRAAMVTTELLTNNTY